MKQFQKRREKLLFQLFPSNILSNCFHSESKLFLQTDWSFVASSVWSFCHLQKWLPGNQVPFHKDSNPEECWNLKLFLQKHIESCAWKKNPMNGALSLCLIQCRIIHRASCQMIQDELTKIHRNKDLGAHSGKLNSHILCSQLNNIIRKNGFSWDACSNLGVIHIPGFQEIRLENTWRSPSKPEKIWSLRPSAQIGNWIVCPQH